MQKKYIVRLTDEERGELQEVIRRLKGTGQKVRRAQILLKADADGSNWTDQRIAEAFSCRVQTVEKIRPRLVERGFQETLNGANREHPPTEKLLNGDQEARVIALRLGPPPNMFTEPLAGWREVAVRETNQPSLEFIPGRPAFYSIPMPPRNPSAAPTSAGSSLTSDAQTAWIRWLPETTSAIRNGKG